MVIGRTGLGGGRHGDLGEGLGGRRRDDWRDRLGGRRRGDLGAGLGGRQRGDWRERARRQEAGCFRGGAGKRGVAVGKMGLGEKGSCGA